MSSNQLNVTHVIIVTEQLQQIDFVENALKSKYSLNAFTSNNVLEIKTILSKETIDVVIIDDAESTLGVGSVRKAITELHLFTPILQLETVGEKRSDSQFIKNGASIVCPNNDALAILHNTELLISYSRGQQSVQLDEKKIDSYKQKFDDLYQGLADPICYLQDGMFVDCNPAFLRTFEVADQSELNELTILNFIDRKHQNELKNHLRKSVSRDLSASPVVFTMQTKLGKAIEFSIMSKPSFFDNEKVVQVYMRSTSEGGGGGGALYDETTALANREQMAFFLKQKQQQFEKQDGRGILAYIMIKNYRDIWGTDGFFEAEKFIKAIAIHVRKTMPAHTELSRYTDDGLVMFIPNIDGKEADKLFTSLIKELDALTPEGMERMVEPICYVAYDKFDKESEQFSLISSIFRAARTAALTEGARVTMPTTTEVAQKDGRRVDALQDAIKEGRMRLKFQPIASFDPDGTERYRERLVIWDEEEHNFELDDIIPIAERYQIMHQIDKWKMTQLFDRLLSMSAERRAPIKIFVLMSVDAMKNAGFISWLTEQMRHTGLGGKHFVFEIPADSMIAAYTGAMNLAKVVRELGAEIAVSKIGMLTNENKRVINDLKPDVIKLDLREIDTLDDNEEAEVMGEIGERAKAVNATLIAEFLESPAQLSRIWPYDVKLIQGDGMTPHLEEPNFNFAEFAI